VFVLACVGVMCHQVQGAGRALLWGSVSFMYFVGAYL
jgi:hypothetical protein